jgi:hypothetical protein
MLYANIQFNLQLGLIDIWSPCKKKTWEVLKVPKFLNDHNYKDYSRWEDLKLKDAIVNLVQWVSIIYWFKEE